MNERNFIELLQERAREQEREIKAVPFPKVFHFIITWLSNHPWRYLIPLAFVMSLLLWVLWGQKYVNFILWMFRGFL